MNAINLEEPIPLAAIQEARERIAGDAIRTPLVRLNVDDAPAEIYLKLETLQPIGAYKIRGAANAIRFSSPGEREHGVYTASAGNMGLGVAWMAREMDLPCTVIVPDHAPEAKLEAIRRLGAKINKVPFEDWWKLIVDREAKPLPGLFVHPVSDPLVMAGNGTIGLEILEDLPDADVVLTPYGGGGISCGVASALRGLGARTSLFACEVATAAPLAPSLEAGEPQSIDYQASFVDGIGGKSVLPAMWPLVQKLVERSLVVDLELVADAVRTLVERNRVVAEGAGATSVAAALQGQAGEGKIVCVVSGGNIDSHKLARILEGEIP